MASDSKEGIPDSCYAILEWLASLDQDKVQLMDVPDQLRFPDFLTVCCRYGLIKVGQRNFCVHSSDGGLRSRSSVFVPATRAKICYREPSVTEWVEAREQFTWQYPWHLIDFRKVLADDAACEYPELHLWLAITVKGYAELAEHRLRKPDIQLDDIATLDQAAALAGLSKRTLERHLQDGKLPEPDIRGGGGKAHRWYWRTLRPALEKIADRSLPKKFPASRIV